LKGGSSPAGTTPGRRKKNRKAGSSRPAEVGTRGAKGFPGFHAPVQKRKVTFLEEAPMSGSNFWGGLSKNLNEATT